MFTGLVETIGVMLRRSGGRPVVRATFEAELGPLTLGESINVDGACLTVDRITDRGFEADMSSETLDRSTLGDLPLGARVHLERATPLGGRMGGHVVLGHVDGVGRVTESARLGDSTRLGVRAGGDLQRFLASKGSVALNGVSLTLNRVTDSAGEIVFDVMLVPHTLGRTALGQLAPGARVNIEVDVLARYVARQLEVDGRRGAGETSDEHDQRFLAKLRAGGFA
jgi:riboflavin synthase